MRQRDREWVEYLRHHACGELINKSEGKHAQAEFPIEEIRKRRGLGSLINRFSREYLRGQSDAFYNAQNIFMCHVFDFSTKNMKAATARLTKGTK